MGAWYRNGTVSVTNGDVHVTGVNTLWATQASQGDIFSLDGDKFYEIASVTDDTHLVLATPFLGATASAQSYEIIRNFTSTTNAQLASNLAGMLNSWHQYLDDMLGWLSGTGTVTVHDANGTAYQVKTPAQIQSEQQGVLTKSVAGGVDVTLTSTEAGNRQFILTGALTANINVILPASSPRVINVLNSTTGAYTVTIKTAANGSAGVTVAQGARAEVVTDGSNCYRASNQTAIIAGTIDGAVIGANNPQAGHFTTLSAIGSINADPGLPGSIGAQHYFSSPNGSAVPTIEFRQGRYNQDVVTATSNQTLQAAFFKAIENGATIFSVNGNGAPVSIKNGITLNGGSSVLSAYEEGTFTPAFSSLSGNVSSTDCRYTRTGRTVHFQATINGSGLGSTANITYMTLPYTSAKLSTCSVSNNTTESLGVGVIGQSPDAYLPAFSNQTQLIISGTFSI